MLSHKLEKKSSFQDRYGQQPSKSVQLQVNITIGKSKYLLQVQRCNNLHEEVQQFLKQHGINLKYQSIILSMVKEQLTKKEQQNEDQQQSIEELRRIKTEMEARRKNIHERSMEKRPDKIKKNDQNNDATIIYDDQICQNKENKNSNLKKQISVCRKENQIHKNSQEVSAPDQKQKCQSLYERWKVKQKMKEAEKMKVKQANKLERQKSALNKSSNSEVEQNRSKAKQNQKKAQTHSPDYFYNKGLKFRQQKESHVKKLYKQQYPFQIRDSSITPKKKNELHDRLFKQQKSKTIKCEKDLKELTDKTMTSKVIYNDKYKTRVAEKNQKINEALVYLIENKAIGNPYKIQPQPKSPFRKTHYI